MTGTPQAAQARPDLGQNQPIKTLMGRVASPDESVADVLSRLPQGEMEAGGQAMGAIPQGLLMAGMAKQFKPGPSGLRNLAQLAPEGKAPLTALERMFPALIDANTNEVVHGMRAAGAGGHGALYDAVAGLKKFAPQRGFVDPETFYAYTEAMLEAALKKKAGN